MNFPLFSSGLHFSGVLIFTSIKSRTSSTSPAMASGETSSLHDVLVIGGGPAGLSAATGLARQLYTVVVFDSGVYRNERTTHMHNFVTWDHREPAEFREKARKDLMNRYETIRFENRKIESIHKTSDGYFQATDASGQNWRGRRLVLATGVTDLIPEIDGYDDCWGTGIFNCLFCHGYEDRNAPSAGVLAIGDIANVGMSSHLARMARRLASKVTVYTHGAKDFSAQLVSSLTTDVGIKVEERTISRLEKGPAGPEVIVHLADGETIQEGFLVHKPRTKVNGPFVHQLSLELTEKGDIKTIPPFYESSVAGVFAVGDCSTPLKAVSQAVAMGTFGAAGVAQQLEVDHL